MNVYEYLHGHDVAEIKVGQSGANVYEIDGRYILKHVIRQRLTEEQFITYTREALFYRDQMMQQRIYLPKVLQAETSENEILILMKKYCRPERYTINAELIQKITKSLAALHTDVPPSFMCKDQKKAEPLSDQIITECLFGWKSVLAEHPGSVFISALLGSKVDYHAVFHHDHHLSCIYCNTASFGNYVIAGVISRTGISSCVSLLNKGIPVQRIAVNIILPQIAYVRNRTACKSFYQTHIITISHMREM